MADYGQTPEILENGITLLNNQRSSDLIQKNKKNDKMAGTEERHKIFTELYDTTNKINKTSRYVFKENLKIKVLFNSKWKW